MRLLPTIAALRAACRDAKARGRLGPGRLGPGRLGLVPTMGALHEGHLSLVRAANAQCGAVAVSIFVNPTQFGPSEDFGKYPRSFERDREVLEREGVDLLFAPSVEEMYPAGAATWVTVEGLSEKLCGRSRPTHFRGVTTVVAKLFHIIEPDRAFFGQKDAAQCTIIRKMVRDLDLPIEIVVCPIVREPDGLAMSSRNAYLSAEQRRSATVLYRSLRRVEELTRKGERRSAKLIDAVQRIFLEEPDARLDYIEVVNNDTLEAVEDTSHGALVAVAAYLGSTRLIDNLLLSPQSSPPS